MSSAALHCGFIPLVDSAPLIVAREISFAAEEGVDLILSKEVAWSALRDKLALGALDAAHLLAPTPVAATMGLGRFPTLLDALSVLSVNGTVIGASLDLAARMRSAGAPMDFHSTAEIGRALVASAGSSPRVGVPFPFSMHSELLRYWFDGLGLDAVSDIDVATVPPTRMAEALTAGEIDFFCVGEPWGSVAVEAGVAELILPGAAIWKFAPEKVLAVRHDWAERQEELAARLIRALWRAARWLGDPANMMTASEILGRPEYLDVAPEIIERSLNGRLVVNPEGDERHTSRFIVFADGAATFPWRSQAVWIATRLAARGGVDAYTAARAARACFRADIHRRALSTIGADLPGASEKLEGALAHSTPVASSTGEMYLGPDSFFDGQIFDPAAY